ncbi:MerR family transcriptional regulator [Halobacillus sp. GSS1]|uniref:MerR family transcriptional regulator n=1 Tax=Halobacillus sp. GSS1 TaxID=2815919 RepID=UPI001A8FCC8F|nr:MerR family transcriptional regulator [Halobacillus sp. GSS1]
MYKISEFSQLTGLSKETLRYYAEVGLLEPAYIHPDNHYRYYDDGSYFLALMLGKLRALGFTIQEMKKVMDDKSFLQLEQLLLEKRSKIHKEIQDLQSRLADIDAFLESGREEDE